MPVLHSYRNKDGHYILAGVNGRIITYRLSNEGTQQLTENGPFTTNGLPHIDALPF